MFQKKAIRLGFHCPKKPKLNTLLEKVGEAVFSKKRGGIRGGMFDVFFGTFFVTE